MCLRDTWPRLNQKLEVPQGAEFNPECSGSDKTMAVIASIEAAAAAAATALSSSSSNGLNGIRTWYPRNNKGLGSKFQSSRVRDKPEEGRRIRRPKRCEKNNLDEEVSPKSIINSNVLVRWFRLHSFASGVRSLFGDHPKIGASAFDYLHIVLASLHSCLYFVVSPSLSNLSRPLTSTWWRSKEHIHCRWFHIYVEDLGSPVFSSHF